MRRPIEKPLHRRLQALLAELCTRQGIGQSSFALAIGKDQTTAGRYLRGHATAGTLDLDEAEAALHHVGGSLREFLAGAPPPEPSALEQRIRQLQTLPGIDELTKGLLLVPKKQLWLVLDLIRRLERKGAKRGRGSSGELPNGQTRARRTQIGTRAASIGSSRQRLLR